MLSKPAVILLFLLAASIAANVYFAVQFGAVGKLQTEIGTLKISNARLGAANAQAAATINTVKAEAARWEAYGTGIEALILP
ncbi:MAG: hypothetical protein IH955_06110 [Chloroflexi bacterium]|nr:hypothetical protein [Chloroflexota bacterium]